MGVFLQDHPDYLHANILERITEPERVFISVFHGEMTGMMLKSIVDFVWNLILVVVGPL